MARLRRPRYLSCFYCGRRSSTANDGSVRQFLCASCDATNYLDENGDITDPPVALTSAAAEAPTPFFASGPAPFRDGVGSPGSSGSGGLGAPASTVFCKTCLKNQHLFISSLAQYFPSDPNHPDTPELERRYFRFRQGLEQRYPQVCADCEPRVLDRIREAGYTAKTDHLRRMVDYSRQVRRTRATPLDAANWLGRRLWWAALLLQLLWHAGVLGRCLLPALADDEGFGHDAIVDGPPQHAPDTAPVAAVAPAVAQPALRLLVALAGRLQSLCVGATLASCWWNPFLVQTVRGFTKPLIGIRTWYAYQTAILLARLLLAKVSPASHGAAGAHADAAAAVPPTVAGAHVAAALFVLYLYAVAPRSIRKDLRPLFGKLPETPLTPSRSSAAAEQRQQQSENRRRGFDTMSDVLDEISTSPQRTAQLDGGRPWQSGGAAGIGSLNMAGLGSTTPASRPPAVLFHERDRYDADEMDWTPTQPSASQLSSQQSPHRAFNTYAAGSSQFSRSSTASAAGFGQTPVDADRGPFWYKVPPAPTSVAQRIFSRPNAPRPVAQPPHEEESNGRAGGAGGAPSFFRGDAQRRPVHLDLRGPTAASSSVEFAPPSFFAEDLRRANGKQGGAGGADGGGGTDDDPGSFLSDLFSQTFSLSAGGEHEDEDGDGDEDEDGAAMSAPGSSAQRAPGHAASHRRRRSSVHGRGPPATRGQTVVRRAPSLLATLASLAVVYFLREGMDDAPGAGSVDPFQYIQPYARLIEGSTAGLCAALALSLTGESIQRWRRRRGARQATALLPSVAGVALGLASLALAGWMAAQMWTLWQAQQPPLHASYEATDERGDAPAYGWPDDEPQDEQRRETATATPVAPWPWWQLACLHSAVIGHQLWNMLVL